MNSSAESLFPPYSADIVRQNQSPSSASSWREQFRRRIAENPIGLLLLGGILIAAHLFVIIFQPAHTDSMVYGFVTVAAALEALILVLHTRANHGQLSLRWGFLAAGFCVYVVTYARATYTVATGIDFPTCNLITQVLTSSCFILALTLPSVEQHKGERILDISIVVVFWIVRFLFLQIVIPPGSPHNIERMTLEAGVRVVLAVLGLMAASAADRSFFRTATVVMVAMFLAMICENEIGYVLFPQFTNDPFALADTLERVGCAVYLYYVLAKPQAIVEAKPHRAILGSVAPFTMTAFVVFLSVSLLPSHPYVGYAGVTFGIGAFLLRIGFMSLYRQPEIVLEESLVREIASEIAKDPLYGLADRYGLEPAFACARSSVSALSPLSLILFEVEERIGPLEELSEETESRGLVQVARALNNWHISDSTTCYLGSGRFAMLLPATPLRIAMSLAEQMCLSVDKLAITGEEGPMTIMAGVAACTDPSRVSNLLYTSSAALERAHAHREGRVRSTPFRGEARFDA